MEPAPDNEFGAGSFTVRGQMTRYETDYREVSHLFPFGIERGPRIDEPACFSERHGFSDGW